MTRKLGAWNAVRGYPEWYYGLLLRIAGTREVVFSVHRGDKSIEDLHASGYRTTTLARKMGVRDLRGYQHVAREAIKDYETIHHDRKEGDQ